MENKLPPLPQPKPENQIRGRRSRAKGQAFEELLDRTFAYYSEKGFAQIDKTPEPMRPIRPIGQGRFLACYTKAAQPDYKGTVKGGRTVMFEAKFTDKDRIQQSAVSEKQFAYLERGSALGARCYVLVGFRSGTVYRIPWSVWADMQRIYGRKYVTEAEIKKYRVQKSWNDLLLILE